MWLNYFIGETVDGDDCVAFNHNGQSYAEDNCKYDPVKKKSWCATMVNEQNLKIVNNSWAYCNDHCSNDKDSLGGEA